MNSSPKVDQSQQPDDAPERPPLHLHARREEMIAEAAYLRAESRGFAGGDDDRLRDWLEAEAEIDAMLNLLQTGARDRLP